MNKLISTLNIKRNNIKKMNDETKKSIQLLLNDNLNDNIDSSDNDLIYSIHRIQNSKNSFSHTTTQSFNGISIADKTSLTI